MNKMNKIVSKTILCAVTLALGATLAEASQINFTGNSPTSGAFGNTRTFSADGVTLTAYAQSYIGSNWISSYLGIYSGGLGVTNSNEGSGGSGTHTVDNIRSTDRIVFSFSTAVVLDSVFLRAYGDTDITAYYFSGGSWITLENNYGGSSSRTADINLAQVSATLWAVGALFPANGIADSFKLRNVTFDRPNLPPPPQVPDSGGSFLLLAIGAGCLLCAKGGTVLSSSRVSKG